MFLQLTEKTTVDLDIPDRPFTFGQLIQAQAAGDAGVLAEPDGRYSPSLWSSLSVIWRPSSPR